MAFGTPVAGTVNYSASGGTSVAPSYPSGITATDQLVLFVGQKPSTANSGTVTTPSGWTLRDELTAAGGYGTTLGADTGNTNLRVYTKDTVTGSESGTLSVTLGVNNVSWAYILRVPTDGGTISYGSSEGSDTTGNNVSVTLAADPGLTAGDIAIWAMCIPTDVSTPAQFTSHAISATGATFASPSEINEPDSGNGNDIGGFSAWTTVSSGTATAAPTITATAGGTVTNVRGPLVLLRMREAPVAKDLNPALYTNAQTFYSATVAQTGGAQDLTPALYTNAQTFYSATARGSYEVTPARWDSAQTFYAPTVTTTVTLAPSLFTNSTTFYAASVTQDGGPQALLPDLYSNAQTFYAATVQTTYALAPALYSNAGEFYAPTVTTSRDVAPGLYTNTQTFYAATVTNGGASTQELVCSDYVDTGYVEDGYVSWPAFNANVFYPPTVGKRYHEIEFVDFEPKLWWLRKPKALPEEVAQDKVQAVARTIQRVVRKKVDAQQEPNKKEVKQAISDLVQDMPGFDWVALYQQIVLQINLQRLQDEELARQEQERLARIRFEQDDEDALILLMAA